MILSQFYKKLYAAAGYEAKITVLKEDYPQVYIEFLKAHDMCYEIAKYVSDCMKMRDVSP